jgi:protein-S-isoprenylcysteine O-methyltransferase Ste14
VRSPAAAPTNFARLFAWGGAIAFVVSLAYFLFSYAIAFGRPASGGDAARAVTWNVVLFTCFAMHHSVFARERVRAWVTRALPPGLERSFYVWVASLLFIAVCAAWDPVPGVAWEADGVLLWLLRLLQAVGVWLTLRSAAILDVRELAGLTFRTPEGVRLPENGHVTSSENRAPTSVAGGLQASGSEFRTTGPYGWVRHPIYTGWFLLVLAASPMTMTRLSFAVVSCAYLLIAIPFEERTLRAGSAGAYERYARQVQWKLLPGVY